MSEGSLGSTIHSLDDDQRPPAGDQELMNVAPQTLTLYHFLMKEIRSSLASTVFFFSKGLCVQQRLSFFFMSCWKLHTGPKKRRQLAKEPIHSPFLSYFTIGGRNRAPFLEGTTNWRKKWRWMWIWFLHFCFYFQILIFIQDVIFCRI